MATASQLRPSTSRLASALQRYFEIALYLLVFTGFGTLVSTGGLSIATALVVSLALLVRGYLLLARRPWLIPESWTAWLTLGYVAFYVADYFLISGGFLDATVHLVLFVMLARLFSARRDRDFYFLSIIAFLMVLAAALRDENFEVRVQVGQALALAARGIAYDESIVYSGPIYRSMKIKGDQAIYKGGEISFRSRYPFPALNSKSGTN
jgi:hypothetical protein